MFFGQLRKTVGQGLVEYADALVVATLLISFALSANMNKSVGTLYQTILETMKLLLLSKTPS